MALTPIEAWRGTLRDQSRYGTPYLQDQMPEMPVQQSLWSKITPWNEAKGETFGTALGQGVNTLFAPFKWFGTKVGTAGSMLLHEPERQSVYSWVANKASNGRTNNWDDLSTSEKVKGMAIIATQNPPEAQKAYEEMPWYNKALAESPLFIGAAGAAGRGIQALKPMAQAGGVRGGLAQVGRAALTPIGGAGRQVFKEAGKAGGVAGRAAQAISAPVAGLEKAVGGAVGAVGRGLGISQAPRTVAESLALREQAKTKLFKVLKIEKPALRETEALRTAERGRRAAMMEKALQTGEPEAALAKAGKLRAGKLPTAETPIRDQFTKEEARELFGAIRDSNLQVYDKAHANDAFLKLIMTNEPLQRNEIALLGEVFGPQFIKAYETLGRKVVNGLLDAANLPRAIITSVDLSATLRQGLLLLARRPYLLPSMLKSQVKSFFSKSYLENLDKLIRSDPDFAIFDRLGGYIAPLPGKTTQLWKAEEAFMTRFARRIPLVGHSERAFIGGLNDLRFKSFKHGLKLFQKMGATSDRDLRGLIRLINIASGRGDWSLLKGDIGPIANAMLFSPRLQLSKFQFPAMLFSKIPAVRKEAWRTMIQFLGFGAGILSMAALAGAKIESDPRSADFGKVKVGDTRMDVWTGFIQYARFASQFVTAERKETTGGALRELKRTSVIGNFLQSKFSPAAGLVYDILSGTTYMGEELSLETESLRRQAYQRLTPLFIQDLIDATVEEGLTGSLLSAGAFFGVGQVTHRPTGAPILRKAKPEEIPYAEASREAYREIEGRIWANYPQELRKIADEIKKLENGDEAEQAKAKRMLMGYPQILMARKLIALAKKRWQTTNKRLYAP